MLLHVFLITVWSWLVGFYTYEMLTFGKENKPMKRKDIFYIIFGIICIALQYTNFF